MYGLPVSSIKSWNSLSSNRLIENQELLIKDGNDSYPKEIPREGIACLI